VVAVKKGPDVGVAPELQLGRDVVAHMDAAGNLSVDVVIPIDPSHGVKH
jgi:hypothetical protein